MDTALGTAKKMGSKTKFQFNSEFDQVLINIIMATGTHVAKHGTKMKKFEGCHAMFLASAEYNAYKNDGGIAIPAATTLRERYIFLINKRRADMATEISASGQAVADPTPFENDLDCVIEEVDTQKSLRIEKKAEEDGKAQEINKRGSDMRDCAMNRKASKTEGTNLPKAKKARRGPSFNALLELDTLEEDSKKHYELEKERIALEREKLALEKEKQAQTAEKDKAQIALMMALVAQLKK